MAKSKRIIFYDVFGPSLEQLGFEYRKNGLFYKFSDQQCWFLSMNLVIDSAGDTFDINVNCLPYTSGYLDPESLLEPGIFGMRQICKGSIDAKPGKEAFEQYLCKFLQILFPRIEQISTLEDALDFSLWIKKRVLSDFSFGQCGRYLLPEIYAYTLIGKSSKACSLTEYYIMGCTYALKALKKSVQALSKNHLTAANLLMTRMHTCEKDLAYALRLRDDLQSDDYTQILQTAEKTNPGDAVFY